MAQSVVHNFRRMSMADLKPREPGYILYKEGWHEWDGRGKQEGLPHLRYEIDRPLFSVGAWSFLKEVSFSKSLAPKTFFLCLSLVFVSTTNSNLVELLLSCVLVVSVLIRCLEKHLCHCSICSYQNTLEFILRVAILV